MSAALALAPRATRREWIGLAVIALPCLLYAMDLTVLNLAVPQLSADLKPTSSQLLWIVDVYGFMVAGLLITMGTLGDRIGRRLLDQRLDADCHARRARNRGCDPRAFDPFPDPQHVRRPGAAQVRNRSVDHQLFGRRSHRPAARRRAPPAFLVGLGIPDGRARNGSAPSRGPGAAARVPGSGCKSAGPGERGPIARGRAGGDLRPQTHRGEWS